MIGSRRLFIEYRAFLMEDRVFLVDNQALHVPTYAYAYVVRGAK